MRARPRPRHRAPRTRHLRALASLTALGLASTLLGALPAMAEEPAEPSDTGASTTTTTSTRAADYAAAARSHGVPVDLLLAVSYLESRWDTHAGTPSTTAGFGPMHLTDADQVTVRAPHHDDPGAERAGAKRSNGRTPRATDLADEPAAHTLDRAATLSGRSADELRTDPAANIDGGAALLAAYQRELGHPASADPARWYAAVARYGAPTGERVSGTFADEVFATLGTGVSRTTDDGHRVELRPRAVRPERSQLRALGGPAADDAETECPDELGCEWIPAPYEDLGGGDYGNHDLADRPKSQRIRYIVIHDTETSYDDTVKLVQDPTYVSWNYTLRSSDGHVAQHVKAKDAAWHAGNWYVNSTSIGLEHEGYAAEGTWFTEAMYRSSAKLVAYLADRYDIPLDRQHVLGHDNVPGMTPDRIPGMHWDPGPYWDWAHYFDLLGAPFEPAPVPRGGAITIRPDYATNQPPFTGCAEDPAAPCPARPSASALLRAEPRADAPLLKDVGLHPDSGGRSTTRVSDVGSRVDTGQQYAVAGVRGDWTAIWYLGQKGWFHNPRESPTAVWAKATVVTPLRTTIPVYGRAYPEASAYPAGVPVQDLVPLPYTLSAGQRYVSGPSTRGEFSYAKTFDVSDHVVVRGKQRYRQIQFGHRVAFVRAEDVLAVS